MEWWEDIQNDRNLWGKHSTFSWKRMKKVLIDLWFPLDYYDILDYTSVKHKSIYSYEEEYVQNMKNQPHNQNYHIQVHMSRK